MASSFESGLGSNLSMSVIISHRQKSAQLLSCYQILSVNEKIFFSIVLYTAGTALPSSDLSHVISMYLSSLPLILVHTCGLVTLILLYHRALSCASATSALTSFKSRMGKYITINVILLFSTHVWLIQSYHQLDVKLQRFHRIDKCCCNTNPNEQFLVLNSLIFQLFCLNFLDLNFKWA